MGNCIKFFFKKSPNPENPQDPKDDQYNLMTDESNQKASEDDNGLNQISKILHIKLNKQTQSQEKISLKDFNFVKVLGRGSFGKVMLVELKETKKLYAMKILKKEFIQKKNQVSHTKAERTILEQMESPFIVQLHFAFQSEEKLYMVTDFMIGGELFFHLRRAFKFTEERAKLYAAELVLAVEYLHSKDIIYRDLKPENILLDIDGHMKITDFGLSKYGISDGVETHTFCGTPEYLAPEIFQSKGHSKAVDWYSLGALIYEMLAGAPPFYSKDKHLMLKNRLEKPLQFKSWFSANAVSLLQGMLNINPKYRLGAGGAIEIKQHPFFAEINWQQVQYKLYTPPFKPKVENERDLKHFDQYQMFTKETVKDTPIESNNQNKLKQTNQNHFEGFTYIEQTDVQVQQDKTDQFLDINQEYSLIKQTSKKL